MMIIILFTEHLLHSWTMIEEVSYQRVLKANPMSEEIPQSKDNNCNLSSKNQTLVQQSPMEAYKYRRSNLVIKRKLLYPRVKKLKKITMKMKYLKKRKLTNQVRKYRRLFSELILSKIRA